jgi:hypothetical protein
VTPDATSIFELSYRYQHHFRGPRGDRCDPRVALWYASIADEELFLSTLVLGEIRKGVELARLQ